jgi:hypothetical protein
VLCSTHLSALNQGHLRLLSPSAGSWSCGHSRGHTTREGVQEGKWSCWWCWLCAYRRKHELNAAWCRPRFDRPEGNPLQDRIHLSS